MIECDESCSVSHTKITDRRDIDIVGKVLAPGHDRPAILGERRAGHRAGWPGKGANERTGGRVEELGTGADDGAIGRIRDG